MSAATALSVGALVSKGLLDYALIVLCIVFVMAMETMNTAVERLCDFVHPKHHATIGLVKDVSSAAVAQACIASVVVAILIIVNRLQ
jgi:diacylglycerol kinase (ATP)